MRHLFAIALVLSSGCMHDVPYVIVDVEGDDRGASQLDVTVSFAAQSRMFSVPGRANGPLVLPASFAIELPGGASGLVTVRVDATGAGGVVTSGTGQVAVTGNGDFTVHVSLGLAPDGGTDGALPPDLGGPDAAPTVRLLAGKLGGQGNADGIGPNARFNEPVGIAGDGLGSLYIADFYGFAIRKLDLATGAVSTLAGSPGTPGNTDGTGSAALFGILGGLAMDAAGKLYVADLQSCRVASIDPASGAVVTIAGGTACGALDASGKAALFQNPQGVAVANGTVYVADTGNETIRAIALANGSVTTVAGTAGQTGSTDASGSLARFGAPMGIAAYGGVLYIADSSNCTIRALTLSTGAVTTLAGTAGQCGGGDGTGSGARFSGPWGVASDGAGNLYVGDSYNSTIRKIVIATAVVTTPAGVPGAVGFVDGTGAGARFGGAKGVYADGAGHVFVTDTLNYAVRELVTGTGAVTTLAGLAAATGLVDLPGGQARFRAPVGLVEGPGGVVYVIDRDNAAVRKIVLATGEVSTVASGVGSEPVNGALDGAGSLFVTSRGDHTIRKVDLTSGGSTTLAGIAGTAGDTDGTGTAASFNAPTGIAYDGNGHLYVTEKSSVVRKIDLATAAVKVLAGTPGTYGSKDGVGAAAQFAYPWGIAVDGGELYVADLYGNVVRKIDPVSAQVTTIAGSANADGYLDGAANVALFRDLTSLYSDGAGTLYVSEDRNATVRKIQLSSLQVSTVAGVAGQSGVRLGMLPAGMSFPIALPLTGGGFAISSANENSVLLLR